VDVKGSLPGAQVSECTPRKEIGGLTSLLSGGLVQQSLGAGMSDAVGGFRDRNS
jgi:hypothetical protein